MTKYDGKPDLWTLPGSYQKNVEAWIEEQDTSYFLCTDKLVAMGEVVEIVESSSLPGWVIVQHFDENVSTFGIHHTYLKPLNEMEFLVRMAET